MRILVFSISLLFCCQAFGQVRLTGRIVDKDDVPIINVTVKNNSTKTSTRTGKSGEFEISVNQLPAEIFFGGVGLIDQRITVKNQEAILLTMRYSSEELEEVVVVGYGTQKKVNLTGSVIAVKGEELQKRPVLSTTLALQGIAPGVTISSTSGQPGAEGESIRIRGIGTLNNNDPLVLIDGVASSLNAVNANDIESISILKDAASSAIYGSRAANGVILITTKRAKDGKTAINLGSNIAVQTLIDRPKMLGALDYLELYDLGISNDTRNFTTGTPGGKTYGQEYIDSYKKMMGIDPYLFPNTKWADVVFDDYAIQQQYNLSVSGGTEKLRALATLNIQDQDGLYPGTNLKRYNLRLNTDFKLSEKFSAGFDILGRQSLNGQPAGMGISAVFRTPPIFAYKTPNGKPAANALNSNPWATSQWDGQKGFSNTKYYEVYTNLKLNYKPVDYLSFDVSYVPKYNFSSAKIFNNVIGYYDMEEKLVYNSPQMRSLRQDKTFTFNQDVKGLVTFSKSFNNQNLTILGGFQQITNDYESLYARRENSEFNYDQLSAFPSINQEGSGGANQWALRSWFGRLNYDLAGKYLLEANIRYDGSSRFYTGYKWGMFPSFSAGWRFSEEKFMKNVSWLSNAKIRASWGQLGNQEGVGNYAFSSDMNLQIPVVFNGIVAQGYAATDYAIQDISWETTTMTNLGVDLGFCDNKLEFVFDYYVKNTNDILMNLDIPGIMGYENKPRQNAGEVQNKGWDFSATYQDKKGDFDYRITAVLSDVKNKILDMKGVLNNYNGVMTNRAGYPIGSLYGLVYDGMFTSFDEASRYGITQFGKLQGGDIRYVDQFTKDENGDGIVDAADKLINEEDYMIIGNTIPRYTYSLDIYTKYKSFDLGLFFQGVGKRDGYLSYDLAWAFNNGASIQQWQKDGMWQEGQNDAKYPRMFITNNNNIQPSSFWKQNAAYLRLKNLQVGYTFAPSITKNLRIQDLRLFASCQNPFTFKHMTPGYDPEMPVISGSAQAVTPLMRTYSLGLNLNF